MINVYAFTIFVNLVYVYTYLVTTAGNGSPGRDTWDDLEILVLSSSPKIKKKSSPSRPRPHFFGENSSLSRSYPGPWMLQGQVVGYILRRFLSFMKN